MHPKDMKSIHPVQLTPLGERVILSTSESSHPMAYFAYFPRILSFSVEL